jgi:hypothetical protein
MTHESNTPAEREPTVHPDLKAIDAGGSDDMSAQQDRMYAAVPDRGISAPARV